MPDPLVGVVIPADPDLPVRLERIPRPTLEPLQRLVGGPIESIPLGRDDLSGYVNEEGKVNDLPGNDRATAWWLDHCESTSTELMYGEYVAGDLVLLGFDNQGGDDLDVPFDIIVHFGLQSRLATAEWK